MRAPCFTLKPLLPKRQLKNGYLYGVTLIKKMAPLTLTASQSSGVEWMRRREIRHPDTHPLAALPRGGILADEMGSGKTAMTISLLNHDPETFGPTLIVVPKAVMDTWIRALRTWLAPPFSSATNGTNRNNGINEQEEAGSGGGALTVIRTNQSMESRDIKKCASSRVVVACHSCFSRGPDKTAIALMKVGWSRLVLDEAHMVKNPATLIHRALCAVSADIRWGVTGTPIQNSRADLLALVKFIGAQGVPDIHVIRTELLLRRVDVAFGSMPGSGSAVPGPAPPTPPETTTPDLDIQVVMVPMRHDSERARCQHATTQFALSKTTVPDASTGTVGTADATKTDFVMVGLRDRARMEAILRCSHACTHAALYHESIARRKGATDEDVLHHGRLAAAAHAAPADPLYSSAKIDYLVDDIAERQPPGTRCIVFCDWRTEMRIIRQRLCDLVATKNKCIRVYEYHGGMSSYEREDAILEFRINDDEPGAVHVLLAQIRSGGTGINLQCASRVYLMRPTLNPALESQAIARAFRRGQERDVAVVRLVTIGSMDEVILKMQGQKRHNTNDALGGAASLSRIDRKLMSSAAPAYHTPSHSSRSS